MLAVLTSGALGVVAGDAIAHDESLSHNSLHVLTSAAGNRGHVVRKIVDVVMYVDPHNDLLTGMKNTTNLNAMSEQQAPERAVWKVYADALQTVGDAVMVFVAVGVILGVIAIPLAAGGYGWFWVFVPLGAVLAFGGRLRMRGAEIKKWP